MVHASRARYARAEGWYDARGFVQTGFVVGMVAGGVIGVAGFFRFARHHAICVRTALGGVSLLLAFIAVRAASFHHIDRLIGTTILGFRFNWIFELGGIAIIAGSALCALQRQAR